MRAEEAENALADVARGRRMALEHKGYAAGASVLIVWGLVWFFANLASHFLPERAGLAWTAGIAMALLWTATRPRHGEDARIFGTWLVLAAYMALVMVIIGADLRMADLLISVLAGAAYLIMGIWTGRRYAMLGAVLVLVALAAWFAAPNYLFLALAIGGGGTLVVGGLWLRRA